MTKRKLCIVGAGGFGREIYWGFKNDFNAVGLSAENIVFLDEDEALIGKKISESAVISFNDFNPVEYEVIISVGDPAIRKLITEKLPSETIYTTLYHSNSTIMHLSTLQQGSVVTAGSIITTNISIGKHAHVNLNSTIGHDCIIGDFFTTAPGVNISGHCKIGNNVYLGTNASVKNGITICDNVTVGMGSVVTKNITEEGVYVGNPLRKLEKK